MRRSLLVAALALTATPALALDLSSPDVADGASIPTKFTCARYGGNDISPALSWSGVPAEARSLAVSVFDPDAGKAGFWHWVTADIPVSATGLAQAAGSPGGTLPAGTMPLPNGAGKTGFTGPCPPPGPAHRYEITVYALPTAKTEVPAGAKAADIGAALARAAIATAHITPVFAKP